MRKLPPPSPSYNPPGPGGAQDEDILAALRHLVRECGSQKETARLLGIPPKVLNDVLHRRRAMPLSVAFKLGFIPVWYYTGARRGAPHDPPPAEDGIPSVSSSPPEDENDWEA